MMSLKKLMYLGIGILVLAACKTNQGIVGYKGVDIRKSSQETFRIISVLASDEFAGREPGTKGFEKSALYVEQFLKENKIQPLFNNSYKDTVMVEGDLSYNIVGLIGDYDPGKGHILLGAHLDHLGKKKSGKDNIYNGADDNASGVTAVMKIAKELKKNRFDKNIIVALFTGEEKGLIGSKHLAKRIKKEGIVLNFMLNFEMIGTQFMGEENTIFLTGNTLSNCAKEMNAIAGRDFVKPFKMEEELQLYYRSDNVPFYEAYKVPCHTVSSYDFKNHTHYHEVNDEVKALDINNMQDIIDASVNIITTFLKEDIKLKMYR